MNKQGITRTGTIKDHSYYQQNPQQVAGLMGNIISGTGNPNIVQGLPHAQPVNQNIYGQSNIQQPGLPVMPPQDMMNNPYMINQQLGQHMAGMQGIYPAPPK